LHQIIDPQVQQVFAQATTPVDGASAELGEAWSRAYGRSRDASDAWDHAIKAVEMVLNPIVLPSQNKGTLGQVLHELSRQPQVKRDVRGCREFRGTSVVAR
jgi:hypothetical protein